jgi:hypothetical protein
VQTKPQYTSEGLGKNNPNRSKIRKAAELQDKFKITAYPTQPFHCRLSYFIDRSSAGPTACRINHPLVKPVLGKT